jgi:hypothetical protein
MQGAADRIDASPAARCAPKPDFYTRSSKMNASTKLALSAVFAACGVLGVQGSAMATVVEAGPICKRVGASNQGGLQSTSGGVRNTTGGNILVVCPLGHNAALSATAVNVTGDAGGATQCTLHSHNLFSGLPVAIAAIAGFGVIALPAQAGATYHAVTCTLRPGAELFGVAYNGD